MRRARAIGLEAAETDRQTTELNESLRRNDERLNLAVEIAHETYGSDDIEIMTDAGEVLTGIGFGGGWEVDVVDGGYWVEARVWVDLGLVEEKMGYPQ
jgi:hypothetical protein